MSLVEIYRFLTELIRDGAGSIAAALLGIVLGGAGVYLFIRRRNRWFAAKVRADNETLRSERDKLAQESKRLSAELTHVKQRYEQARIQVRDWWAQCRHQVQKLNDRAADAEAAAASDLQTIAKLRETRRDLKRRVQDEAAARADLGQKLEAATVVVDHVAAVADDRRNPWLRPATADVPRFTPLAERGSPVIAVLNFKGGVGKTTLTANLAATFAERGERVLLIDLDYQGSLTQLAMPHADLRVAAAERRLVQDFFAGAPGAGGFRRCIHAAARGSGRLAVVPAADPLSDVETWLQIRWLLQDETGDVRFALRAALHDPAVFGGFDRVLIDCPPRLTTACVNALACCDYVLIPVILDHTSTVAAPRLLHLLRELRPVLMGEAVGVGLVANRTSRTPPAGEELDQWGEVAAQCGGQWGRPVDRLPTTVPSRVTFRDAANAHRFAVDGDQEIHELFAALAVELEERVTCDRRRPAPVPR